MAFSNEKFRLFWRFDSDTGTFVASSTAEGYDVVNLQRDTLDKKWKSNTPAAVTTSFSVSSEDTSPQDVFFKPDGTKMYMVGVTGDGVYQYTLTTPWDLGTASYDNLLKGVGSQDSAPIGIFFKPDGTKLYMVGQGNDKVYQYTLSTAWLISSATYDTVFLDVSTEDIAPTGISFKSDGTKMYMVGTTGKNVYQYSLTAWDLNTASYDSVATSVNQDTFPQGIFFKSDGTKMYMVGATTNKVYQYSLGTAWDLNTASYDSVFLLVTTEDGTPTGIFFSAPGLRMYMMGLDNRSVYNYALTTEWDLSTASLISLPSQTIIVDLGSSESISAFALLDHDLIASDGIVLRYANDDAFSIDAGTVALTFRANTLIEYFTAVSRRYWRLEITLTVLTSRESGRFLLADHYQMERNVALGWSGPQLTEDTTRIARTEGGQKYADIGVGLKSLRSQFVALSEADLDELEALKGTMLTGQSFIISQNWEDFPLKRTLYGSLRSMSQPTNVAADKWTIPFNMVEQK